MTSLQIAQLEFSKDAVAAWKLEDERNDNWPVVYLLDDRDNNNGRGKAKKSRTTSPNGRSNSKKPLRNIYVGESLNAVRRLTKHLATSEKQHLKNVRVIFHEKYNKSVCLDLESYLIKMMAGDGANQMLNRNNGITEAKYYQRDAYRKGFIKIFEQLKADGVFTRTIPEIENSALFKLSPFKALTEDQTNSVEEIVGGLLVDVEREAQSTIVIQGDPGTGKSVVAIYLIKLLVDIQALDSLEDMDNDLPFSNFFTTANHLLLKDLKIGLVVPQQSLRETIKKVFRTTRGLRPSMVLTPFDVGKASTNFDLIVVDETHRLNQRANQGTPGLNKSFAEITNDIYGWDDTSKTQLDWILAKSRHRIFLLDSMQSVRPADLPPERLTELVNDARGTNRHFQLRTQMRVQAGSDFVSYVRWFLDPEPHSVPRMRLRLGEYHFRLFDTIEEMRDRILRRETEVGLSRMVAGYAWEWKSKNKENRDAFDIEIGDTQLRWNSVAADWVGSQNAHEEVGSIHTVQGYDLNYVGVIIGLDLRFDPVTKSLKIDPNLTLTGKGKKITLLWASFARNAICCGSSRRSTQYL